MFASDVAPFAAPTVQHAPERSETQTSQRTPAPSPAETRGSVGRPVRTWTGLWKPWPFSVQTISSAASTEIDRGIAFILAPVFLALGAFAYYSLAHEPALTSLGLVSAALAICIYLARARPLIHMALAALLLCATGALLAKIETWRAGTSMLGGEVTTRLTGRIAEVERMASGRVRMTIDVTGTQRPVLRYAPDRVRISARRIPPGVTAGALVSGLVRLMPPSGPVRPDSYDFSFESYFDGIGASGFFMSGPELMVEDGGPPLVARFRAGVERMRYAIAERISSRIGGPEGEIAAALVVGVRAGIPEEVNDFLRRSGIYHVISISGLHMALVAGTIMGLLRAGFALFPDFASRFPVKKLAAVLALAGLSGYLFISGAEVAAQRSYIMLAVMLIAVLFDRAALTLRNLAISAVIVIAISPHEVVGPSFQMSFAATAALVGAYAAWADWRASHPRPADRGLSMFRKIARYLLAAMVGLAMTSIVAGGATAIYAAWHFQQMPSLGLFTNLTAMPVVSVVVMPFAVLGSLAMPFGLDGPFFDVMGMGLAVTIAIARWFAERSPIDVVGLITPASVAFLTVALLVATLTSTRLRAAAIPFALIGTLLLIEGPKPDILVSEDGRLVGVDIGEGRIAVNRARPNSFTLENWKRAMLAAETVKPAGPKASGEENQTGFICDDGVCLANGGSGLIVAHLADAKSAVDFCSIASVIVIEDASARNVCQWKEVLVVNGRDLAVGGSAAITIGEGGIPEIQYAIARPYRPWHEQRKFSRSARGLPPYRGRKNQPADESKKPIDTISQTGSPAERPEAINNAE